MSWGALSNFLKPCAVEDSVYNIAASKMTINLKSSDLFIIKRFELLFPSPLVWNNYDLKIPTLITTLY